MLELIQLSELASYFDLKSLGKKNHIGIVGGGGKTTILHALGRELPGKTVLTCTTKMGYDQNRDLPVYFEPEDELILKISPETPIMAWKEIQGEKAIGVDPSTCDHWFKIIDNVVVEADGSRRLPFKAPAHFEPVIPESCTVMISTIGADALDQIIDTHCHRPQRVADFAECFPEEYLTPERAAKVILHPEGQIKAKPPQAQFCVVITKVDETNVYKVEELVDLLRRAEERTTIAAVAFGITS
tara:strand:+ start:4387 stop:5115 length:729 start_codon:yes stop_codon:yes gene_type:complete